MSPSASIPGDPRVPGFPPGLPPEVPPPPRPDVPFPPRPGRPRPDYPPVPTVPMPSTPQPSAPEPLDDLRSRVYDQLLARRAVLLDRALDGETAMFVAAQLMTLDAAGTEHITLIVNSPGGPLDAAATVLDTIDLVRGPVDTTCLARRVAPQRSSSPRAQAAAGSVRPPSCSSGCPRSSWRAPRPASATRPRTSAACTTPSSTGWPPPLARTVACWPAMSTAAACSPRPTPWPMGWSTR